MTVDENELELIHPSHLNKNEQPFAWFVESTGTVNAGVFTFLK